MVYDVVWLLKIIELLVVRYVCLDRIPGVYSGYWEALLFFNCSRGGVVSF